jgi:Zn-finger nucleic acid-binding protein
LITVEQDRVEIDVCTCCRGVWLDAGELELILRRCGCDEPAWAEAGRLENGAPPPDARPCPVCGKKMQRGAYAPPAEAALDRCPDGDGLWFDRGELKTVLAAQAGAGQAKAVQDFLAGMAGGEGGGDT